VLLFFSCNLIHDFCFSRTTVFFAMVYQYSEAYLDKKFCHAKWMSVNNKASLCMWNFHMIRLVDYPSITKWCLMNRRRECLANQIVASTKELYAAACVYTFHMFHEILNQDGNNRSAQPWSFTRSASSTLHSELSPVHIVKYCGSFNVKLVTQITCTYPNCLSRNVSR
jgi:hypothetical protein